MQNFPLSGKSVQHHQNAELAKVLNIMALVKMSFIYTVFSPRAPTPCLQHPRLDLNPSANALKKAISCQKHRFVCFWWLLTFLSALKKILITTTFVCLLLLKLKQKKNFTKFVNPKKAHL